MTAAIVIPARYASSRFPGKPLCAVSGVTMLERVWRIASSVKQASRVVIASDDERILAHARSFFLFSFLSYFLFFIIGRRQN